LGNNLSAILIATGIYKIGKAKMSWLLFLDESGHDHKQMPYEVFGGVAIQDRLVWPFIRSIASLEENCFGTRLAEFKKEFKGSKLLDKNRYEWASQDVRQSDQERKRSARAFLTKGLQKITPTRAEFTGYGQACLEMAQGVFRILREHDACIFASVIPRSIRQPPGFKLVDYLRKDHVYLFERFHHFVQKQQEQGLIVMDRVEDQSDIQLVRRMERYFTRTVKGAQRADWIVPAPFLLVVVLKCPNSSRRRLHLLHQLGFPAAKVGDERRNTARDRT
jgi:hypothetical protein